MTVNTSSAALKIIFLEFVLQAGKLFTAEKNKVYRSTIDDS